MSISLDFTLGTFTKLPVNFSQLIYPTRHTIPFIFHSYRQIYFLNSPLLYLPKLRFVSWCYCCLRCAGENSWSVISVKYQQTAWWHFNLNFDKLSYFGQKCKHWQGQGSRQVLLIYFFFYQQGGFYPEHSPRHIIRPLDHICHLTSWHVPEISNVFLARPCDWCGASNVCTCLCQIWLMYF